MAVLAVVTLFAAGFAPAQGENGRFGEGTIFAKITGDWEGRGELNSNDGTVTPVTETWTGKREGEATFEMTGTRTFGDEEPHTFTWRYLYNPTTELIECEMTMSTMEQPMRFEVQVSEAAGTVTLKGPLGDGGELKIVNKVTDGKIVGEVTMTDANGNQSLTGTVEHRRPGKWDESN